MNLFKFILLIVFVICFGTKLKAKNDTLASESPKLFIGLTAEKNIKYNAVYSPTNTTLFGLSFGINNFVFHTSANYTNKAIFEKRNYIIGSRDRRIIPLSGYGLSVFYVHKLHNKRIIHPMIGFEFISSTIYGGWERQISAGGINFYRTVNFTDKFKQYSAVFGFYFSSNNKFGYSISCPIGVASQNNDNSHIDEQIEIIGGSLYYEAKPEGFTNGFCIGLNFNLFYHFNKRK